MGNCTGNWYCLFKDNLQLVLGLGLGLGLGFLEVRAIIQHYGQSLTTTQRYGKRTDFRSQLIFTLGKMHGKFVLTFHILARVRVRVRVRVWLP